MMHDQKYTDESPTRLSRLKVFNSTYALNENGNLQDVSLTNPESLPFVEFIPATSKSPQRVFGIVGVVIFLAVLGISGAIALPKFLRVSPSLGDANSTTGFNWHSPSIDIQDVK
ncbi:MAG: hypothetical protein RIE73_03945 [Coleofasciculus sp. C1-SOL-03]|jgi:hypothetical protein|uniref:hypothetical protein n=1 Tax=Coleofasciculus sp. C1-SOL-03 TaxID=3069522 RepID=UPI0032FDC966